MNGVLLDLRAALRLFVRTPALSLAALLCLALGIGANTATFSVVHGVLLEPLPYDEPERLVWLWGTWDGNPDREPLSDPDLLDLAGGNTSFAELGAYGGEETAILGTVGSAETVRVRQVSAGYLRALAGAPAQGRLFSAGEELPDGPPVALLSEGLRRRRFASRQEVVGSTLRLGGVEHEVIGLMAAGFRDLSERADRQPDVWVPVRLDPAAPRGMHRLLVIGRLAPGAGAASAQQELDALAAGLSELHPATNRGKGWRLEDLQEGLVRGARRGLLILLAAVGLILLIACANVAALLLARAGGRARETAMRATLGAGRLRLLRQHLVESLLLAVAGGAAGVLLAAWGTRVLVRLAAGMVPLADRIGFDGGVLAFALAASLLTTVLCGLLPWLASLRTDLVRGLRGVRASLGPGRLGGALVAAEVALALVVALAAGLLLQSFQRLRSVDPGFRTEGLVAAHLRLPAVDYPQPAQAAELFERLVERHRVQAGVEAAALAESPPVSPYLSCFGFAVEGRPPFPPEQAPCADLRGVGDGYFETLGIPLLAGRPPRSAAAGAAPEAVVNRLLQRQVFPGESPLGRRIRFDETVYTVVGVVGDTRTAALSHGPILQVYRPLGGGDPHSLHLVARAGGEPEEQLALLRGELDELDPGLAFDSLESVGRLLGGTAGSHRVRGLLMSLFAVVGLVLSGIGVFGLLSQAVGQRTREIGVRMAVGARPRSLLLMVLRQGLAPVVAGVACGLLAAAGVGRVLSSLLYEAGEYTGRTYAVVPLLILAIALGACWLPARRALRVDPARALRVE